jgi:23S rRNA (cytosine1962-C5)-methyltransferase
MATEVHLTTQRSLGYELLDSGDHQKLERYGSIIVARPDTQAIWTRADEKQWARADAYFAWHGGKGSWKIENKIPEPWLVELEGTKLLAKLTSFKHTGIFPEQIPNWQWLRECVLASKNSSGKTPKVLNLFGYTGAASIVAALAGAEVTHVDSSKTSVEWAKTNAAASGLPSDSVRWVIEDVRAYVKREIRRGEKYDGILLDPPAFGRGNKDEVWKIEEDLLPLLTSLKELLASDAGSFFLLNGYASGYSPLSFSQLTESVFPKIDSQYGELRIKETGTRELPAGMYVRFQK